MSTKLGPINFLDLPNLVRDKIYEAVLVVLHPIYIFQESNSSVEAFAPDKPPRWLALLHTNRQISAEASAVLYRVNHFELVDITKPQIRVLQSFLNGIGTVNAASISNLSISFPTVIGIDEEPGKVRLKEDSLQCLKVLQDRCTNLSALETVVHYRNSGFFMKTEHFLRGALSQIDQYLKTINSLRRIIVRFEEPSRVPTSAAKLSGHQKQLSGHQKQLSGHQEILGKVLKAPKAGGKAAAVARYNVKNVVKETEDHSGTKKT
ncbi:hypothetical protein A1O3_03009 [Capronia epimyces CBS 606.96]|uniref:Uncharacterized protein n=1 Tax=Capronia epimyces CBS 606.96 TaxID=1182542 RepID=W9YAS2_9EURO|nr:uncharacterized protein A1O3_03009 [Capronia epimyces CBS 606.96]EXJ89942.1 hypothetical protein A1O3_03009 [Capronia epimyces CBS 606.96]